MSPKVIIYDSRSAAFLNYILSKLYESNHEFHDLIFPICNELINFNYSPQNQNRTRYIIQHNNINFATNNSRNHFRANLLASWIIEYLVLNIDNNNEFDLTFELFDKAFFMLGFDLSQLNNI